MPSTKNKSLKKRLVVKIGTSTLTRGTDKISRSKIRDLAHQISVLKNRYDIILVSSGAIATARQIVKIDKEVGKIGSKQALAAIGQPRLMRIYDEVFKNFGLCVAQCLMTYRDFENETSRTNTRNTVDELLEYNYVPIINENDTVAVEEILLGDNDKLSALVASVTGTDLLIIASDIDGLFDKNPHLDKKAQLISEISDLKKARSFAKEKESTLGTGGMTSKIRAAEICAKAGIEMWVVNGGKGKFLLNTLGGTMPFTKFKSAK